jgi:methenyltetrahydrofolate cyclohydrolase
VSSGLWHLSAERLLERVSSRDPTPGGGAVAAVTASFAMGLVRMAIEVTITAPEGASAHPPQLADAQSRARQLQARFVEAADRDVAEFEAMIAGYRMPQGTDGERAERRRAIDDATVTATRGPLDLAEASVTGIALVDEIEPFIKPSIVSDAHAGRDLLRGAALAALRTADINLATLEERGHLDAPALRERRDALLRAATNSEEAA